MLFVEMQKLKKVCSLLSNYFHNSQIISFSDFLCEIVEILLYILLPEEDFQCTALRYVLREIFSNCVILPLFSLISDPDYINQVIIWLVM